MKKLTVFYLTHCPYCRKAKEALRRLLKGGYGVIYMTEHTGELLKKERAKYDDRVTPAIILIPGVFGNTGEGIARVKGSVEQAVGSDILFGNE